MYSRKTTFFAGLGAFVILTRLIGKMRLNVETFRILVFSLVGACIVGVIGMALAGIRAKK